MDQSADSGDRSVERLQFTRPPDDYKERVEEDLKRFASDLEIEIKARGPAGEEVGAFLAEALGHPELAGLFQAQVISKTLDDAAATFKAWAEAPDERFRLGVAISEVDEWIKYIESATDKGPASEVDPYAQMDPGMHPPLANPFDPFRGTFDTAKVIRGIKEAFDQGPSGDVADLYARVARLDQHLDPKSTALSHAPDYRGQDFPALQRAVADLLEKVKKHDPYGQVASVGVPQGVPEVESPEPFFHPAYGAYMDQTTLGRAGGDPAQQSDDTTHQVVPDDLSWPAISDYAAGYRDQTGPRAAGGGPGAGG